MLCQASFADEAAQLEAEWRDSQVRWALAGRRWRRLGSGLFGTRRAAMIAMVGATVTFVLVVVVLALVMIRIGRVRGVNIAGAARAPGVIVEVMTVIPDWDRRARSMPLHHPRVRFTTPSGLESTFTSDYGTSRQLRIGQQLDVLYDPANPSRAQVSPGSWPRTDGCARAGMWAFLAAFTFIGILGLSFAWLVFIYLRPPGG